MDFHDHIRKSRLYSYIMSGFACYWLSDCLQWIYSLNLDNLSTQTVALSSAVLTALCTLIKMIFTFATHKSSTSSTE